MLFFVSSILIHMAQCNGAIALRNIIFDFILCLQGISSKYCVYQSFPSPFSVFFQKNHTLRKWLINPDVRGNAKLKRLRFEGSTYSAWEWALAALLLVLPALQQKKNCLVFDRLDRWGRQAFPFTFRVGVVHKISVSSLSMIHGMSPASNFLKNCRAKSSVSSPSSFWRRGAKVKCHRRRWASNGSQQPIFPISLPLIQFPCKQCKNAISVLIAKVISPYACFSQHQFSIAHKL